MDEKDETAGPPIFSHASASERQKTVLRKEEEGGGLVEANLLSCCSVLMNNEKGFVGYCNSESINV